MEVDLNADLGEGADFDDQLMPLITSANVCCGQHAGGPNEIAATLERARIHGVQIGAHPGYPDREHFGRVELELSDSETIALIQSQLTFLISMAREFALTVNYVKPHGALYNQACRDPRVAAAVVAALLDYQLPVVGLPDSQLANACRNRLPFVPEGFADRRYRPDGSLVARTEPDAFIHNPNEAVKQVEWLLREKGVRTICLHGDNPAAVAFAKAVRLSLVLSGMTVKRLRAER